MFKHIEASGYQIKFTTEGLCLSPFKTYSAVLMFGQCITWCEGTAKNLDLKIPVFAEIHDYKVIVNLNCWDLLTILECEFNRTEDLVNMCYPLPKNELSEDKSHE